MINLHLRARERWLLDAVLALFLITLVKVGYTNDSSPSSLIDFTGGDVYVGREKLPSEKRDELRSLVKREATILDVDRLISFLEKPRVDDKIKFVRATGYDNPGDGGHGLFLLERKSASSATSIVDGVLELSTGSPRLILRRIHSGSIDIRAAGAKGDGVSDDTIAIRRVLDTRLNITNQCKDCTFLVGPTGRPHDGKRERRAALVVHAQQAIDLNGATLRLRDHTNSFLLANEGAFTEGASDSGITIERAVLDGNVQNQKTSGIREGDEFSPTLLLHSISHSTIKDVEVKNYYGAGIYITYRVGYLSKYVLLDRIRVKNGLGPGLHIDGEYFTIGDIEVQGARPFVERGEAVHYWGAHPNSIAAWLQNSNIESIRYKDCSWGFKLQDGSRNVRIGTIRAEGVMDGQAVKLQGMDDERGYRPNDNVLVDLIVSANNNFNGLYIIYNTNIRVKRYEGMNNGLAYRMRLDLSHHNPQNFYDVLIIKSDAAIDEIISRDSRAGVLYSHEAGTRTKATRRFGRIEVKSGKMSNAVYLRQSNNEIDELIIGDAVSGLDSAVYFDMASAVGDNSSTVKVLQIAEGVVNPDVAKAACDGKGPHKCMFVKVGRSKLFGVVNGNRVDRSVK